MFATWDQPLDIKLGETYNPVLTLYKDAAETQPYDLTGFSAQMVFAGLNLTLTNGNGLTLGGTAGTIAVVIASAVTTAFPVGDSHYYIKLTDGTGNSGYPVSGRVDVAAP